MESAESTESFAISSKVKEFLTRKLTESQIKIGKLKRKRTIYKTLFIASACGSIVISGVLVSISSLTLPAIVIPILSITSGVLTAISAKFSFQDKNEQISREIKKLNKIQNTLDYVISCNGDITREKFQEIISEFDSAI
jgi:hypothetical protein